MLTGLPSLPVYKTLQYLRSEEREFTGQGLLWNSTIAQALSVLTAFYRRNSYVAMLLTTTMLFSDSACRIQLGPAVTKPFFLSKSAIESYKDRERRVTLRLISGHIPSAGAFLDLLLACTTKSGQRELEEKRKNFCEGQPLALKPPGRRVGKMKKAKKQPAGW